MGFKSSNPWIVFFLLFVLVDEKLITSKFSLSGQVVILWPLLLHNLQLLFCFASSFPPLLRFALGRPFVVEMGGHRTNSSTTVEALALGG